MTEIIRFPIERRIDQMSADAVRNLVAAQLIDEPEAVRALTHLGCPEGEIDLVRSVYAVRRATK